MKRVALAALVLVLTACADIPVSQGSISGRLMAGPICPVETEPPDPACADRPVEEATVTAISADGGEWTAISDEAGRFRIEVDAGLLTVRFGEVEGLLGTPVEMTLQVAEGADVDLGDIGYDTGVR